MNELFEEYISALLRRAAAREGRQARVESQRSRPFWRKEGVTRHIRPDLVVSLPEGDGGTETVVLDTKWKVPVVGCPDDTDLKQMYAYNLQFGAVRSFLVYPRVDGRSDVMGHFASPAHNDALAHGCGMWFAQLFDGERLNKDLGHQMLGRLQAH